MIETQTHRKRIQTDMNRMRLTGKAVRSETDIEVEGQH